MTRSITCAASLALLLGWRAPVPHLSGRVSDIGRSPPEAAGARPDSAGPPSDRMLFRMLGCCAAAIGMGTALWIATQVWTARRDADAVARALTGGEPARAAALVTRYGCGGCHTISGLPGAEGQVGPPLTGLRHRVFIGGVLPNTADNLVSWIVAPRRFSPGSAMPPTGIGRDEASDVAAYLYAH